MILEHLGQVKLNQSAFCIGMGESLEEIKQNGKRIIVFGTGINAFILSRFLQSLSINVHAYIDNDCKKWDRVYAGNKIYCPKEAFELNNCYIFIAVPLEEIRIVRIELMNAGIDNYSIFFTANYHSFEFEEKKLHKCALDAINYIMFEGESTDSALPRNKLEMKKMGGNLGNLEWILSSTLWSHWAYLWIWEYLGKTKGKNVLEIGPGYGTLTLTMMLGKFDCFVDWMVFSKEISVNGEEQHLLRFEKELKKIYDKFPEQINYMSGLFELDGLNTNRQYDLIVLSDVFEHFVLNPVENMLQIADYLKDDGIIILTTPNWGHIPTYDSWEAMPSKEKISRERYFELINAVHAYQYSFDEMKTIIEESGLKIIEYKVSDSNTHNFMIGKK